RKESSSALAVGATAGLFVASRTGRMATRRGRANAGGRAAGVVRRAPRGGAAGERGTPGSSADGVGPTRRLRADGFATTLSATATRGEPATTACRASRSAESV